MAEATIEIQPVEAPVQVFTTLPPNNLSCIKGLAITQLVVGVLTLIFGIASIAHFQSTDWYIRIAPGIWLGGWIIVTGTLGVCSANNWSNSALQQSYLVFNILTIFVALVATVIFLIAVLGFGMLTGWGAVFNAFKDAGLAIYVPPLVLMFLEFWIAIVASCVGCNRACCGVQAGYVVQAPQQKVVIVTNQQSE